MEKTEPWHKRNPELHNQNGKQWRLDNPEKYKEMIRKNNKKNSVERKRLVVNHYSQSLNCCSCCLVTGIEFLTIDHVNGGGREERKRIGKYGTQFYWWLISQNYPDGYQVLCYNCNCARDKSPNKICPHKICPE